MKAKKSISKIISISLALIILFSAMPVTVFGGTEKESIISFMEKVNSFAADEDYYPDVVLEKDEIIEVANAISDSDVDSDPDIDPDDIFDSIVLEELPLNGFTPDEPVVDEDEVSEENTTVISDEALAEAIDEITDFMEADNYEVFRNDDSITISQTYQTKRLIVSATKIPDDLFGGVLVASYCNLHVIAYDTEDAAANADTEFNKNSSVKFSEPDRVVSVTKTYNSWGWDEDHVNADNYTSWLTSTVETLPDVKVAVIDTGVDYTHELFAGRVDTENGYDFYNNDDDPMDDHYHGTHVSGTIVEATPETVRILPIKALNASGAGTELEVYAGIVYATEQNVDVINMSLGGTGSSSLYEEAINDAVKKGIVVCVAAGNSNCDAKICSPANIESAITVGALDSDNKKASFSNYGDCVDISAPGVNINSSVPKSSVKEGESPYKKLNGTSMATPHVAAACALLKSYNKNYNSSQILTIIKKNATGIHSNVPMGAGALCLTDIVTKEASKLILSESELVMYPGQVFELFYVANPQSDAIFVSSDDDVVSVEDNIIEAKQIGSAEITATANGVQRTCTITVSALDLSIDTHDITLYNGVQYSLSATSYPKAEVEYLSMDENVAKVSSTGRITVIGNGETIIKVTAAKGTISEKTEECRITVQDIGDWYDENNSTYTISSARELFEFAVLCYYREVSFADKTVEISDDVDYIDLSSYTDWIPIGNFDAKKPFEGTFDGKNKPIKNMRIIGYHNYRAFFGYVNNAVIKNVILENCNVSGYSTCAGLAAIASFTTINNCSVSGSVIIQADKGGGLCSNPSYCIITNCANKADVSCYLIAGGIGGFLYRSEVINCLNSGNISGLSTGGIAGVTGVSESVWIPVLSVGALENNTNSSDSEMYSSTLINCANVGTAKTGICVGSFGSFCENCFWYENSASKGLGSKWSQYDGSVFISSPVFYSFDDDYNALALENMTNIIDRLNTYALSENTSRISDFLSLWSVENSEIVLGKNCLGESDFIYFDNHFHQAVAGKSYEYPVSCPVYEPAVIYSSSDPDIATVNNDGTVFAHKKGTVTISASTASGKYDEYTLSVLEIGNWYNADEDVLYISTGKEFIQFADMVNSNYDNFEGKLIKLADDIDISERQEWITIGGSDGSNGFLGSFNGCSHTISGLTSSPSDRPIALFNKIVGTIENLYLDNVNISAKGVNAAALCCFIEEGAVVRNITTLRGIIYLIYDNNGGNASVGGIAAINNGTIEYCTNNLSIKSNGNSRIGGICGINNSSQSFYPRKGVINHCVNNGSMLLYSYGGGIVCISFGTVINCVNNGRMIIGSTCPYYVGGVQGEGQHVYNSINNGCIDNPDSFSTKNEHIGGIGNWYADYDNCVVNGKLPELNNVFVFGYYPNFNINYNSYWNSLNKNFPLYQSTQSTIIKNITCFDNGSEILDALNLRVAETKDHPISIGGNSYTYDEWGFDTDNNHFILSSNCSHSKKEWFIDEDYKCLSSVNEQFRCVHCGKVFEERIIETETHDIYYAKPTCFYWGGTWCKMCGTCLANDYSTPRPAHVGKIVTIQELSCKKIGIYDIDCVNCGIKGTIYDYQYAHIPTVSSVPDNITCIESYQAEVRCSACDLYIETKQIAGYHNPGEWITDKEPSCGDTGKRHKNCLVCNETIEEEIIPATGDHILSDLQLVKQSSCSQQGFKCRICSVCGKMFDLSVVDTTPHPGIEWVTTEEATCSTSGQRVQKCTVCKQILKIEKLPLLSHISSDWITETESTCIKPGQRVKKCTLCEQVLKIEELPILSHVLSDWTTERESTCREHGQRVKKCTICGTIRKSESLELKAHTPSDWIVDSEATCTREGHKHIECTVCHTTIQEETIPEIDHTLFVTKRTEPTCTQDGSIASKCRYCSYFQKSSISPIGHTLYTETVQPTCIQEGSTVTKCRNCDFTRTTSIPKTGRHTFSDWIVDSEATCTTIGYKHIECTVCKSTIQNETIPVTTHTLYTERTEPTCTQDGSNTTKCRNCDYSQSYMIYSTGHTLQTEIIDASCTTDGQTITACSVCGYTYSGIIPATGHSDGNKDGNCDYCGTTTCSCKCHSNSFIWKLLRIFYKLFRTNPTCACGASHY